MRFLSRATLSHYVGQFVRRSIRPTVGMFGSLLVPRSLSPLVHASVCSSVRWSKFDLQKIDILKKVHDKTCEEL